MRILAYKRLLCGIATLGITAPVFSASAQDITKREAEGQNVATPADFDPASRTQETLLRLIDEGKNRNQTMAHLRYLCEEIGPRLTGSTRLERACHWAADRFRAFGLQNVALKPWGEIPVRFDRGECKGRIVTPVVREMEFTAKAWSVGTEGPKQGPVVREPQSPEELDSVADRLEGAWILRPAGAKPSIVVDRLNHAGIAGFISTATAEIVNTGGVKGVTQLKMADIPPIPTVTIRRSDYDAINSRIMDGEKIVVEFDLKHTLVEGPFPVYNTVAEIPGSTMPEEIVIISAHLDSWDGPGSQGTVDNGTGSAVTIEAARILTAIGAKPKRTIRFILWSGEEQGLLGSKAYVQQLTEVERKRISAVFVDDSGTNQQASLTCVEPMAAMLREAILPMNFAFPHAPIKLNVAPRMPRGGASDHSPFNAVGVPGFFWGKSGTAVYRHAWHTQNDRMDQAVPEYLTKNSTVSAIAALVLADANTLLPRAPVPAEENRRQELPTPGRPPQLDDPSNLDGD
ncbi:Aminopeptidase S [Pirellula sp. SH-Sr6A]|uniref:M20/M25/M40 family metallo-hydrolase n=1 Tax=Pirellula sp. SH-Sr6A TaxID=1632865 RepID=UPI00078D2A10|nr:M20/M25/M40 family metallo-hydrolase [Pirellula sp. SH-Sr6A]AMV31433.1 Aminopeptidase S [Pirellula sp. SH-Sr6A]